MLTYDLDMRGNATRYHYLYLCIKHDIETGVLVAGDRLPSKRTLARHLSTSLITVETAYEQLIAEGYIRSETRRGYYVNHITCQSKPAQARTTSLAKSLVATPASNRIPTLQNDTHHYEFDLTQGQLSSCYFPCTAWAKAAKETITPESMALASADCDCFGLLTLRQEIARHLFETRGLIVNPAHILIGAGAQVLYNLIIQLLGPTMHVGLEDPGYPRLTQIYHQTGIQTDTLPLDDSGLMVDTLRHTHVNVAHIMPSHQFPTGIIMPISRRYELLGWATEEPNRYIIEDDYDCEFKLAGKPVPTLKGIDANERVIYANTFSKSLGMAVRVAYIVLPPHLADQFRHELSFYTCTVSAFDQLTLATFMHNGSYERYVNKTRTKCRAIRNALINALEAQDTRGQITFSSIDSGLHFIMSVRGVQSPELLQKQFRNQDIHVFTLADYARTDTHEGALDFIVNYPNISLDDVAELADSIMAAINQATVA